MNTRYTYTIADEQPAVADASYREVSDRSVTGPATMWSPAQVIGLLIGLFFTVLGVAALVDTGFDTSNIHQPHEMVWGIPHSPLLGAIEIAFGVLVILASVVPGAARSLMTVLGVVAVAFGLIVLLNDAEPDRLNDWLAVTNRNGWLHLVSGVVLVLAAIFSPVFTANSVRRERRQYEAHDGTAIVVDER